MAKNIAAIAGISIAVSVLIAILIETLAGGLPKPARLAIAAGCAVVLFVPAYRRIRAEMNRSGQEQP